MSLSEAQFGRIFTTLLHNAAPAASATNVGDGAASDVAKPQGLPHFLPHFSGLPTKRPRLSAHGRAPASSLSKGANSADAATGAGAGVAGVASNSVDAAVGHPGKLTVVVKALRPPYFIARIEHIDASSAAASAQAGAAGAAGATVGDVKALLWQSLTEAGDYALPGGAAGASGVKLLSKGRVLHDGVALSNLLPTPASSNSASSNASGSGSGTAGAVEVQLHVMMPAGFKDNRGAGTAGKEARVLPTIPMAPAASVDSARGVEHHNGDDSKTGSNTRATSASRTADTAPSSKPAVDGNSDGLDGAFAELAVIANKLGVSQKFAADSGGKLDGATLRQIFTAGVEALKQGSQG